MIASEAGAVFSVQPYGANLGPANCAGKHFLGYAATVSQANTTRKQDAELWLQVLPATISICGERAVVSRGRLNDINSK